MQIRPPDPARTGAVIATQLLPEGMKRSNAPIRQRDSAPVVRFTIMMLARKPASHRFCTPFPDLIYWWTERPGTHAGGHRMHKPCPARPNLRPPARSGVGCSERVG